MQPSTQEHLGSVVTRPFVPADHHRYGTDLMPRNMMHTRFLLFALVLVSTGANPGLAQHVGSKPDESKEPPLNYLLKMGDKSLAITEGETIRLEGTLNNPEITLTVQSHREFAHAGIAFEYPRAFVFEASLEDPNFKKWTLSGVGFKTMYVVSSFPVTIEDFTRDIIERIGRENCTLSDATMLTLGNQEIPGTSISVTLAGARIDIDVYRVTFNESQTKFLVLQQTLDSQGNRSIDAKAARDLLTRTCTLEK